MVCLVFFLDRGAYRALWFSTTGDFSTVYAAARCWLHGENPYDRTDLVRELARAGAPADIQREQQINPFVYLPAALPWMSPFAILPWRAANTAWCLLSLALFGLSLWTILQHCELSRHGKWLAASAALLFSPTYVGVYDGNPGVVVIALIALSILRPARRVWSASGIALGIALCFKPQLALAAIGVFLLWRRGKPLIVAALVFALATTIGITVLSGGGHRWLWWQTEQDNVKASFVPGGQSDPAPLSPVAWQMINGQSLSSYLTPASGRYNGIIWLLAAVLLAAFLVRRARGAGSPWQDIAFCSAVTLTVSYHRYYDAQLLLLLLPLLACLWRQKQGQSFGMIAACLLLLAFPIQSWFARQLGEDAIVPSLKQLLLLRNQPAAVLLLCVLLAGFTRLKGSRDDLGLYKI